ncbi:ferric siderophore receptor, putative, TonB receptor family [Candidatus Moduliflexus flocculans]|uniref:Ferric siderophore receptor, putative, TonB receptor family n=1 Tax=Candidatus Moduliflexus flocculans TaxID=1499966 RepID=A0A0S6W4F6_9BACT|nr:ferric siderophore receptor, putative, TonB receptor family [Candidatus Moduliflexus flocculans]
MKAILRGILFFLLCWPLFGIFDITPCDAANNALQRRFAAPYASDIPFLVFPRYPRFTTDASSFDVMSVQKTPYLPGDITPSSFTLPVPQKVSPTLSRAAKRRKLRPEERKPKEKTGITLDLDAGYGNGDTFISRFQHGTQFKGAHYTISGHWEQTDGTTQPQEEYVLAGKASFNMDISKQGELRFDGNFFSSDRELSQIVDKPNQKKSAIQAIADLRVNASTESPLRFTFSWERDIFTDYTEQEFFANCYRSDFVAKYLWGRYDTLTFQGQGMIQTVDADEYDSELTVIADTTLANTFVWRDMVVFEFGGRFAYSHAEEQNATDSLLAPLSALRLRLGETTTFYVTYQPTLITPLFSDLYIKTLYTSLNSSLSAETRRHVVESGIQQRFGKTAALNVAAFYQEREHLIALSDENLDYLLTYTQEASARFFGIKAGWQVHFLDQFVHALTYTYTDYEVTSRDFLLASEETFDQHHLPYQPHHHLQANLSWIAPYGFKMDISGLYVSEQYRNWQSVASTIGGRFSVNISFSQAITDWAQVYALVRNLTDTAAYEISPVLDNEEVTSSRMFLGGIRLRF